MFVGEKDELANVEDNRWAKTQLKTVVHYKEYNIGHIGFFINKDMSYFNDVMSVIGEYHSLPVVEGESVAKFLQNE